MTTAEVLAELESMGNEGTKRMLMRNHCVPEPCFGVKIGDLKKIQKRVKRDHALALALWETGNYDARYLAGLIADDARMTKRDLQRWANTARGGCLSSATVAWVAAQGRFGWEMGRKWIDSPKPHVAEAGWSTLSCLVALREDADLDLPGLSQLITRVRRTITQAPGGVLYQMNNFLVSVGCYVTPLTRTVLEVTETLGPLQADLGNNACKIPYAPDYIRKVEQRGALGKKRKTVKC